MKFPARERVLYEPNPLTQVICTIHFSRILAIDHELPVGFQQDLIQAFPFLETEEAPIEKSSSERGEQRTPSSMIYEFNSADRDVTIALGADFVGVRTLKYERWEKYQENISTAVSTLLKHYSPKVFTRISLNYINVIDRKRLDLSDVPWRELIMPALIGPLADEQIPESDVEYYASLINLPLADGKVRITAGLVSDDDKNTPPNFLIDNLFFSERAVDADERQSIDHLTRFNAESGCVFRWCIKQRLHEALNPRSVD
ncbi:MAG: TIGR04255 family protein [Rhodopseudomonas sp.]|uniref:TIGR04255 family protein n=1 Tax=Rhodopseudomonas sp. TaxID=1078 RepID=UPI0017A1A4EC|nr:TIGR04255 family protein [Rhodopseudomonas sp.]NVN85974.1 TIGR04255 family protein [Rhodopseudomonas sp.]